jgi:hypothetical protein
MERATENSRRQHVELRRHADELLSLIAAPELDGATVQRTLSRMSGLLKMHVAMEIEGLYPQLLEHQDDEVRLLATRTIDKLQSVYEGFLQFRSNWHADAVQANREAFIKQASFVARAFGESTQREEEGLYAHVDAIFAGMPGRA